MKTEHKLILDLILMSFGSNGFDINPFIDSLSIEDQYILDDNIFYKLSDYNVSFTRNFNRLDYTRLGDSSYLLREWKVEKLYTTVELYQKLSSKLEREMDIFNKTKSLPNMMSTVIQDYLGGESHALYLEKMKNQKIDMNNFLMNGKITLKYAELPEITGKQIDAEYVIHPLVSFNPINETIQDVESRTVFESLDILIKPTDSTIKTISEITNPNNNVLLLSLLMFLMIAKYDKPFEGDSADDINKHKSEYFRKTLTISELHTSTYTNNRYVNYNELNIMEAVTKDIIEYINFSSPTASRWNSTGKSSIIKNVLLQHTGGEMYYYLDNIINSITAGSVPVLNLDYADFSDEHLLLFRESITNISNGMASYVSKKEKEIAQLLLMLGRVELRGKKHTRETLESHLGVRRLDEEIRIRQERGE